MMKTYRIGFLAALIGNVVLGVVLVGLRLHYRAVKPMADSETKMANSTAKDCLRRLVRNFNQVSRPTNQTNRIFKRC